MLCKVLGEFCREDAFNITMIYIFSNGIVWIGSRDENLSIQKSEGKGMLVNLEDIVIVAVVKNVV